MIRKATFSKWWKVGGNSIYGKNEGENCKIAEIETERFDFQKQDVDDCARLIAAAPELFEQCKFLERMLASGDLSATHDGLTNCNMLAQLREILANVDGGEG